MGKNKIKKVRKKYDFSSRSQKRYGISLNIKLLLVWVFGAKFSAVCQYNMYTGGIDLFRKVVLVFLII